MYLIADDYIAGENAPDGQGNTEIVKNSTYELGFDNVYIYYNGARWISSNSKGSKWLSQFLGSYGGSTNSNIRAVAYMMDTNVWSAYYAGEDAEYAMGGPTIEMFCASYKDTHPSKYLECGDVDSSGYHIRWNGDPWGTAQDGVASDFNQIYIKPSTSRASGMWLASPSTFELDTLLYADCVGSVSYDLYNGHYNGLRPIVCLKSDTKLERLDDGTFQIIKPPVTADDISKAPAEYYGAEVINYDAPHEGVDKWRIFYADGTNVYLIADDYIAGENAPKGQGGSDISISSDYYLGFNNVIDDYGGASWISQNSKGSKWLSQFLDSYGLSTHNGIKAAAYMMDTNVWSAYYASEDAEYAMGGPTLEMFCASYKDTHSSKYLECGNVNLFGYQVRWNGGAWADFQYGLARDDFNSIYLKSDISKASAMWLASPSAKGNSYLMYIYCLSGYVDQEQCDNKVSGIRPIVCLKPEVQLEKQTDGTFMIVK